MSATLGDVTRFEAELTERTGRPTTTVRSASRPVPLDFSYRLTPVLETVEELIADGKAPIYVVHFTQASAIERAQAPLSTNPCTREEKDRTRSDERPVGTGCVRKCRARWSACS